MLVIRRLCGLAAVAVVVVLTAAAPASAHVRSTTGYSTIRGDGDAISYALRLDYELLARAVGLGPAALDARDDAARTTAISAKRDELAAYVDERVVLFLDGAACASALDGAAVEQRHDVSYARLDLTYECPGPRSGAYRLTYDVFSETDAVVDDHANVVDYRLGGDEGRFVLDAGHKVLATGDQSFLASTGRFATLGVEHILLGADHVLFVVALLLGATSVMSVVKVASMFTLAHSVTLGMAVLGWVDVPAYVVEPLIALSIAFVALENLFGGESRHRLAVVFGFGLLHGLGFAGSLRVTDEVGWGLVGSLLSFNLGIEIGQALLVFTLVPLLWLVRRFSWSTLVHVGATATVAVFGLVWFFERVTFV